MLPRDNENAVAGHLYPVASVGLDHTGLIKGLCSLLFTHCVGCYVCRLVEIHIRFSSEKWGSTRTD